MFIVRNGPHYCHAGLDPASRRSRPGPRLGGRGDSTGMLWFDLTIGENLLKKFGVENQPQVGLCDLLVGVLGMAMANASFCDLSQVIT